MQHAPLHLLTSLSHAHKESKEGNSKPSETYVLCNFTVIRFFFPTLHCYLLENAPLPHKPICTLML